MEDKYHLSRFTDAQRQDFDRAYAEIKAGRKVTHWMWYIFPQLSGLGFSSMAQRYGIGSLNEAAAYLQHPVLGPRLISICEALLRLEENNATRIMGSPDDMKLRSSMTLFSAVPGADAVFQAVLSKFFSGMKDEQTLQRI
ncbi:DUF1810 domain-containing protein [Pedobacter yulinensis]|uniref:DUF1810 domain-containing protein n=1 Tax=Pedobacter yulinensis TaxID=2126353 RepID=A0A2T3HPB1_9SPHI|nr:DUF1810 domain-containing protein [Pedobacter yulinensis]PST84266.1 DUF1810 domain-containing protein [Pedobacter yulinensis]